MQIPYIIVSENSLTRKGNLNLNCIYCGSEHIVKEGFNKLRTRKQYRCKNCKRWFSVILDGIQLKKKEKKEIDIPHATLNINRLKKVDILWLFNHRCHRHGVPYLQHPKCFLDEKPKDAPFTEKIGFLDIESSDLKANIGHMYSWCIKELNGPLYGGLITKNEIEEGRYDKRILQECIDTMRKFDRIVVFYGGDMRFDLPFVRSRAVYFGLDFPIYKELQLLDLYLVIKRRFKLTRNSLQAACSFFGIPSKQHQMEYETWMRARIGHKESLDTIFEHNKEDVISTEALYKKVIAYSNVPRQSL